MCINTIIKTIIKRIKILENSITDDEQVISNAEKRIEIAKKLLIKLQTI
jgi:hypothetical protein